jgi:hypothetical protein
MERKRMAGNLKSADAAAQQVLDVVPRLIKVTNLTVISFGLAAGTDQVIREREIIRDDMGEVARGARLDNLLMTVLRLALLLDPNAKTMSYQGVRRCLERTEVISALTQLVQEAAEPFPLYPDVSKAVELFRTGFERINWERYKRLKRFRNQGVAHLDPEGVTTQVHCEDVRRLVYSVASLGEAVAPLVGAVPVCIDEIAGLIKQTVEVWRAFLRPG